MRETAAATGIPVLLDSFPILVGGLGFPNLPGRPRAGTVDHFEPCARPSPNRPAQGVAKLLSAESRLRG